ncbi:MAG: CRISPR-associated helicase Cas3' [Tissierellia bacterium]|nr:CRISPR-associated helicase Cas3' [Tissierellia bacterium]
MEFIARRIEYEDEILIQSLESHLEGVGRRARDFCQWEECKPLLELLGLLHDAGKANPDWQRDLLNGKSKLPPHSRTGMFILRKFWEALPDEKKHLGNLLFQDMMEYAIGAHHGLFDCQDKEKKIHCLDEKIFREKSLETTEETLGNYFSIKQRDRLENLYDDTMKKVAFSFAKKYPKDKKEKPDVMGFDMSFITRMFLSMLIDADWTDSASLQGSYEEAYTRLRNNFSWEKAVEDFEGYIEKNFSANNDMNTLRTKISDECKESAGRETGVYKLNVPTGAGKTVAAMRFALHHAKKHKKQRIFYLSPYISILEQNADTYHAMFSSKSIQPHILEYHSNLVQDDTGGTHDCDSEAKKYISENFAAPVILTTFVQFLNSLFSSSKQALRRLHRFQNSVIIIDEIQSAPLKSLSLLHLAINALNKFFDTTFVICSATIPTAEENRTQEKQLALIQYSDNPYLTKDYREEVVFQRFQTHSLLQHPPYTEDTLSELLMKKQKEHLSVLCVVNTRKAARIIYDSLCKKTDIPLYHLSNNMCVAHRRKILEKIRGHKISEPHIIISTNLIEAGVDLSVGTVIRSLSKMDSLVQAGGRCNRHNELKGGGHLYLVELDSHLENTEKLMEVRRGKEKAKAKLIDFQKHPERYKRMLSDIMLDMYFKDYYKNIEGVTHYEGKQTTILNLLAECQMASNINHVLQQSFLTAGESFQAIENAGHGVIVPYGKGKEIIADLLSNSTSIHEAYALIRKVQNYSINVYEYTIQELCKKGALIFLEEYGMYILKENYYDEETGLNTEKGFMETIVL